ncbi:winged helix-turn-helix transcriptional regulator [Streptomyces longispororuber]|uniref:winged helix-turn-helix transcriptional regulator n=1 Tax=Streptomyces longispororuber TaxID=68230 RepID=UPI0036FEDD0E
MAHDELRHLRGIGMAVELIRNKWTYAVLVALLDGAMCTPELLVHINKGNMRNADLLNEWVLHEKTLLETLRRMEGEGLIARRPAEPRAKCAGRELTPMAAELLEALSEPAAWATRHADLLLRNLQVRRGVHAGGGEVRRRLKPEAGMRTPSQERWRNLGVALTMLRLRWSFAVISGLRHGPLRPTGLAAVINENAERNRHITGHRNVSDKVLWGTLHRLSVDGVVAHEGRGREFASTARCSLTDSGHDLLAALAPMGYWAARHEEELVAVMRARLRGLAASPHKSHPPDGPSGSVKR